MNQHPDRISVAETAETLVQPEHVVLSIVVEGEATSFSNEAFRMSKEVGSLVNDLAAIDYSSQHIVLEKVSIDSGSGKFLKSTSARFNLRLSEIELELTPKVLGIIASHRNCEIIDMKYEFGDLREKKAQLLKEACLAAKQQAHTICDAFGMQLMSVHSLNQRWIQPFDDSLPAQSDSSLRLRKSASMARQELEGLEFVTDTKGKLILNVQVEFRVSEF